MGNSNQSIFEALNTSVNMLQNLWFIAITIISIIIIIWHFFKLNTKITNKATKQIDIFSEKGKYIRSLFVELNDTKELIRYFIFKKNWISKLTNLYNQIFCNYAGKILQNNLVDYSLSFHIKKKCFRKISFSQVKELIKKHFEVFTIMYERKDFFSFYKEKNKNELEIFIVLSYTYKKIFNNLYDFCNAIESSFILITGTAGNGKTNLLCSTVEHLLSLNSPCIFLDAKEIKRDLNSSIMEYLNVPKSLKNSPIIHWYYSIVNICLFLTRKKLYFVVDAINENDRESFKLNIANDINNILKYKNFRIIMSCRTEYFEERYANLFANKLNVEPYIYNIKTTEYSKRSKRKIHEIYAKHFSFNGYINPIVSDKLLKSSLLLSRLFYEVYRNGSDIINSLNSFELYHKYLSILKNNCSDLNIDEFLKHIVSTMISNKDYEKIVIKQDEYLRNIIDSAPNLLDNNMLLYKKITKNENSIAETTVEVLQFVFDELRDYCIARYLIIECNEKDNYSILFDFFDDILASQSSTCEGVFKFAYTFLKTNRKDDLCEKILINYMSNNNKLAIFNRRSNVYEDTFRDLGMNLIFNSNTALSDFEKIYIRNIIEQDEEESFLLFDFLLDCGNCDSVYSLKIYNEILADIQDAKKVVKIINPFLYFYDEYEENTSESKYLKFFPSKVFFERPFANKVISAIKKWEDNGNKYELLKFTSVAIIMTNNKHRYNKLIKRIYLNKDIFKLVSDIKSTYLCDYIIKNIDIFLKLREEYYEK